MKITITIECDNEAFKPDPSDEVRAILTEMMAAARYADFRTLDGRKLRDSNGNTVGKIAVTGK